jgi:peptidoglycan/xylan/chitin deacetylase (PgdA/CDA1 family)
MTRVCFTFHESVRQNPLIRHVIGTMAELLEVGVRVAAPGECAAPNEVEVFTGPRIGAPETAAIVVPCDAWESWPAAGVQVTKIEEAQALVLGDSTSGAPLERELPEFWLRGAAFMLSREEEFAEPHRDEWGCFSAYSSRLHELGVLSKPLINQYAAILARRLNVWCEHRNIRLSERPRWKGGAKFAVVLSHDVDAIRRWSVAQAWRLLKQARNPRDFAFRHGVTSILDSLRHAKAIQDPMCSFDRWMAEESRYGYRSTFYFCVPAPKPRHPYDPTYRFEDAVEFEGRTITCGELMRVMIERGFEVGLHGSYLSHESRDVLSRGKSQVEKVLGRDIAGLRQHFLRFDARTTWSAQEAAGFDYDSTLGYNEAIGFRAGIAAPFHPWNASSETAHRILELPMTVMDGALFRSLKLSPALAARRVREHIDIVEAVGGLAVLLWHPDATDPESHPGWWDCYRETLAYLATRPAWVATGRDIAAWWTSRESKSSH